MILNDRFVFVHVPKTGGQSITQALGGKTEGLSTHTPLRHLESPGDRFTFGFVRNPWARLVSLYRFMCQKPMRSTDNFDQTAVRDAGFKRWLMDDRFYMAEDANWNGGGGGGALEPMQRRPQTWWLDGCGFIGRYERIGDDLDRACALMDMTPPRLPHINRTEGRDWRREYDGDTLAFVARHFVADVEGFGYCAS